MATESADNRGIFNIKFAVEELQKLYPKADYHHLTLIGHSNGGDIAMYLAKLNPEMVKNVVRLDNLRVPFLTDGKRSCHFARKIKRPIPASFPTTIVCSKAGITVVKTEISAQRFERSRPRKRQGVGRGKGEQLPRRSAEGIVPAVDGSRAEPVGHRHRQELSATSPNSTRGLSLTMREFFSALNRRRLLRLRQMLAEGRRQTTVSTRAHGPQVVAGTSASRGEADDICSG
jgi:pimeloyl-ACP methyl ester carboxylesterase